MIDKECNINHCLKENNPLIAFHSVAFVVPKLGRGGAERVVMHLVQSFYSYGIETICICLEELGALGEELSEKGFRVECIESQRGYDFKAAIKLFHVLRRFNPSLINVHGYGALPYVAFAYLIGARYHVVFTGHGLLYSGFESRRFLYKNAGRCLSGLTAVTAEVANKHRYYLNWKRNIHIIENGIPAMSLDFEGGKMLREEFGIPSHAFVFLVVGNIRPEKGVEDLLEAVRLLSMKCSGQTFAVVVAGSSKNRQYFERILDLAKTSRVNSLLKFVGHRRDMSAIYSLADVFVLPSRSEGLPMVVLEAMSCRLPVVATRVGGIPSILSDGTGIIVDPIMPEQLASEMAEIMSNPGKRKTMGEKGYEKVDRMYSVDRMANGYINAFEDIVTRK